MEATLRHLVGTLQQTLEILKGSANAELRAALHNHDRLPAKETWILASQTIDLLHETEQLLEPGPLVLADHFLGFVNTKCLCAAVELDIPDLLQDGPKTLSELSIACKARPDRLRQVLRVLYNNGIFSYEPSSDQYSNNSTSTLLLVHHWTQWRNWVDLYGNEFYDMACGIPASCKQDAIRNPAQITYDTDTDMFTYFSERGWTPRLHKTLSGGATAQAPGIVADYPWKEIDRSTFLDVGGGSGGLVALLLREYREMRAGILDLPQAISQASANFHKSDGMYADLGDRVESLIAGDFLVEIPSFEVYTMKWCLHDWNDSKALKILTNIRAGIIRSSQSRLIILESLLSDGRMGRLSRYADLIMMVSAHSGQERDESQWKSLAEQTGWSVKTIYPLRNAWPCAIELVPVWDCNDEVILKKGVNSAQPPQKTLEIVDTATRIANSDGLPGPVQVTSEMIFLEPWDTNKGNPFIRTAPEDGFERTNITWVSRPVQVNNARSCQADFHLDTHGFAFYSSAEAVGLETVEALRANDKSHIEQVYYPFITRLVQKETGAKRILIFDHTIRRKNPGLDKQVNMNGQEQPATMVHCDQSAEAAIRRLAQCLNEDDDLDVILRNRVQMINVWRPLRGPVDDWPLAMMDYRSVAPTDVHPTDLWQGKYENPRQTITFCQAEEQVWWYLHRHRTDEVTMIKIWDNQPGEGAKFCPHAAFEHPETKVDALPRESVEVRCLVLC